MADWEKLEGNDENLPVTHHSDVYPAIDPQQLYATKAYQGKVVLVTGASRGIGQEISLQYARAGATLAITARAEDALEETKRAILAAVPSAQVLVLVADVRDVQSVERVVLTVLARFEKLDILVANAGAISVFGPKLHEKDPNAWWNTFEVNIRGAFNFFRAAATALERSRGCFVAMSSTGAQVRIPGTSDMNLSKFATNRLIEFIVLEYPSVRAFVLSPGVVRTRLLIEAKAGEPLNTVALPAATTLYLTSGRADWLSGRYYSANWDITEVERDWKDAILAQKALVNKLSVPSSRRAAARL
jgi:NADP-dependent 3-hydroxy acid dehydrogenase YdfG